VKGYDGDTLWFNITEDEAKDNLKKDRSPKEGEYSRYKSGSVTQQYKDILSTGTKVSQRNVFDVEERLPLIEKKGSIRNTITETDSSSKSIIEDLILLYTKV
jgi:hypothetical protein